MTGTPAVESRSRPWQLTGSVWPVVALSVGVGLFQIVGSFGAADNQPERESLDAVAFVLLAVGPVVLAARQRYPLPVLVIVTGATLLYIALGYPYSPIFVSFIIALFTAVNYGHRLAAWGIAGISYVYIVFGAPEARERPDQRGIWPPSLHVAALLAWVVVILLVSEGVRVRRERMADAVRAREEEARRLAGEERLRIARELHDVLAHNISLINVQAGTALHLMDEQPQQARTALTAIKDASKEALSELRSVLDVLRAGDEQPPRSPTPGLADLDDLVTRSESAGLVVDVEVEGVPRPLPPDIDRAAFRITQEALTNVTRHAGDARATIRVSYGERDLTVQVVDDGRGAPAVAASGGGSGIAGMRERAAALGGKLQAGPRPGGGFQVRARLPSRRRVVIRVLLADDQALVRAGFRALLDAQDDIEVVGEADDGEEAVALARSERPDIVLMDIRMPGVDGLEATRRIAADERLGAVRVVVLTTFELDEYVFEAIRAGASGFLVKDTEPVELLRAVRSVAAGDALLSPSVTRRLISEFASRAKETQVTRDLDGLTDREREVMGLAAEGLSNEEIAERLFVSPATAKTHVSRAMVKLGARDRAQLVVIAYESGLVRPGWTQ